VLCLSIVFAGQIDKKNLLVNSVSNEKISNTDISSNNIKTQDSIIDSNTISKPTTITKPNENKCSEGYSSFIISIKKGDNFISFPQGTELTDEIEKEILAKATFYEYSNEKNEYQITKQVEDNKGYIVKSNEEFEISLCKTCENEDYVFELNNGAGWYLIPGPYSIQKTDLIKQQINSGPYILDANRKYQNVDVLEPGASYWVLVNEENLKNNKELRINNICARERPSTAILISDCMNITTPGNYELGNDIVHSSSYSSDICIFIKSNNVTLDCKQFSITSNVTPPTLLTSDHRIGILIKNNLSGGSEISSSTVQPLRNILIQNCDISNFVHGIKIETPSKLNNENITLFNNYLLNNRFSGIGIDGSSNILIKNNIALKNRYGISFYGNGSSGDGNNHTIKDNILINNSMGLNVNFVKNSSFINNSIDGIGTGITLFEAEKNNITKNYIKNTENAIFIQNPYLTSTLYASNNLNYNFVEENDIGYIIKNSRGNMFKNETANNNTIGFKIEGNNNFFYNTTATHNTLYGIYIPLGATAKFHDNLLSCYNAMDILHSGTSGSVLFPPSSELICNISNPSSICLTATPCSSITPTDTNLTGLLIYDLIDNDWADRDSDKLTCRLDTDLNYSPFTNGIGECEGPNLMRRYGSEEIDGLFDYSFSIGSDDFTEKQNIWIKGQSMYETDGPPYLDIRSTTYSIKFIQEGTEEKIGIPVCQDDNGTDDWSYCVRTGTGEPSEETIMERPQIQFLGDNWILLDMQPPAEGGSQANENYREFGGEITLAKEAAYGVISFGERLLYGSEYYLQLDDISVGTGPDSIHPAIVSLYYSNGTYIEQTSINPGETVGMGPADEIRVHVYQTASGLTPSLKWAEIAILSDVLVLEDGDSVDDDENEDWYIKLAWKNKEGDSSLTSDSLREIILYNDNSFDLEQGDTFNIIENPAAFEFSFPGFPSVNTTKLTFEFDDADLEECRTGAILNPSREDQMWVHITTEEGEFESILSTEHSGPEIFVALKNGTITGTTTSTLDFGDVWVYNEIDDCVDEESDGIFGTINFDYNKAGINFGSLSVFPGRYYENQVVQCKYFEEIGPVSSIEHYGGFSFTGYNGDGDWQFQINIFDDSITAQYTVFDFLPSSDPLHDLNLEVEDEFISLRGTQCLFSNTKYEFEIPEEVVTLEPNIEPIIPEDEPSESPCTIRSKSATLEIIAGPMTEEIELNEGETYSVWPGSARYNITLEEIGINLGNVSDVCEYCPITNKSTILKIKQLSTDSTTTWTAHEEDSREFGDITITVNEINAEIGPAEPCCEECEDFGLNTTLLYVGDNISIEDYYIQLVDIFPMIHTPEPFIHGAAFELHNATTGSLIEYFGVFPLEHYIYTAPNGDMINISVCKTHHHISLTDKWACVNATFIPYEHPCISNCTNITEPGYYELCGDITAAVGLSSHDACIDIQANDIELNGRGHSIFGEDTGYGISINGFNSSNIYNTQIGYFYVGIQVSSFNNTFMNNTLNFNNLAGIWVDSSSNNHIIKNTANFNSGSGIYLRNSFDNNIINNTVNFNSGEGIFLYFSSNNLLLNNSASYNANFGISLWTSSLNTLKSNTNLNNGNGIIIQNLADHNLLINNSFDNNEENGIKIIYNCFNNTLINNTATNNSNYGILLDSSSNNNTLTNNTACFNNASLGYYEDVFDNGILNTGSETTCDTSYPSGLCDYPCTAGIEPFNCTLIPETEPVTAGMDININIICERAGEIINCPEMEWIPNLAIAPLPDYYMNPRFDNETSIFNTETITTSGLKFIMARNITNGTINGFCTANIQVIEESECNPWIVKLNSGYNTISLPIDPFSTSPASLFPGLDVWIFNNSINNWQTATEIEAGRGYLIHTDIPRIFTIYGEPQDTYDKPLSFSELDNGGWHLIGVACENTTAINEILSETSDGFFHCYNTGTGEYEDKTTIHRGQSCFIIRG
jgi:parallel beta-helix repeat protein